MSLQNPIAPLLVVATNDACRDESLASVPQAMLLEYRETRDLESLRPLIVGEPTLFEVRRLSPVAAVTLDSMSGTYRLLVAFQQACHRITLPDGAVMEPPANKLKPVAGGGKTADDDWFNACAERFGLETVYEIAAVAYQFARMRARDRGPFVY